MRHMWRGRAEIEAVPDTKRVKEMESENVQLKPLFTEFILDSAALRWCVGRKHLAGQRLVL